MDDDLPEQMRIRREKRIRLLESGREPYPVKFPRTASQKIKRELLAREIAASTPRSALQTP